MILESFINQINVCWTDYKKYGKAALQRIKWGIEKRQILDTSDASQSCKTFGLKGNNIGLM